MNFISTLAATDAGVAAGVGGLFIFWTVIIIAMSAFWLWMLIDCLSSSMPSTEKLIWFLVIFFLHIVGAGLYYFIGRPNHRAGIA